MISQQKISFVPSTKARSFLTAFSTLCFAFLVGIASAQPAGNIQFINGGVEILRGTETFSPARATLVNVGDLIRTSADGNIHINMIDGAFLSLRPGSEMRVEKYEYNPMQTTVGDAVIGLIRGTLRTFTGEIVSRNRDRFKMRTAVATLGIRGSGNVLAHYDAIGTINHTLTGAHAVTSNAGGTLVSMPGQTIQVLPGQAPRYIPTPAFIAQAASPPPKSTGGSEPEKAAEPAATAATTSTITSATPPPPSTSSASQANTSAVAAVLAATRTVTGGVYTLRGLGLPVPPGYQGLFVQTNAAGNTSAVLNAAGQLIEIRNADISANIYGNATFPAGYLPFGSPNATGIFSGGTHLDGFSTADGSVTIGRWSGGSLTLVNNTLPSTDANYRTVLQLGSQSASYGLVIPTLSSIATTFTGTTSYNLLAATAPVDARGNVGTLSSATVGVNFSLLTARLNAALAVNNQNLTLSGNSSFQRGSTLLQWTSGLGNLNIGCSGANCAASGYNGSVAANIAGTNGNFMGGQYRINPIRASGGFLTDLINGHFVLQTTTNPALGSTISDPNLSVSMRAPNPLATGGYEGFFPQGGMAILNGAGQMIGATNTTFGFATFISSGGVPGIVPLGYTPVNIANASYEFVGGQHRDAFRTTDNSIILGRWEGGTIEVNDPSQPTAAARIYTLGPRSAAYGLIRNTDNNTVAGFTGSSTYSLIGSTRPTDGAGNVGTLNAWTVGFNFNNLTATLNGSLSINNQNLVVVGQAVPFQQNGVSPGWQALDPNNPTFVSTMAISCTGSNCSSRGYVGVTNTSIAGANGQFAAGQFRITPAGVAGGRGAMPDHITAFYALQAANTPTVGNVLPQTGTATLSFGSFTNVSPGFLSDGITSYTPTTISGTLNANFTNRSIGFNATVNSRLSPGGSPGPTFGASAANVPLVGVGFSAATGVLPTNVGALTVTCSGQCAGIQTVGRFDGFFLGNTGSGGRVYITLGSNGLSAVAGFGTPGTPVAPVAPASLIAQDAGRLVYAMEIGAGRPAQAVNAATDLRRRNGPGVIN